MIWATRINKYNKQDKINKRNEKRKTSRYWVPYWVA